VAAVAVPVSEYEHFCWIYPELNDFLMGSADCYNMFLNNLAGITYSLSSKTIQRPLFGSASVQYVLCSNEGFLLMTITSVSAASNSVVHIERYMGLMLARRHNFFPFMVSVVFALARSCFCISMKCFTDEHRT
jgi:hypothetical protein